MRKLIIVLSVFCIAIISGCGDTEQISSQPHSSSVEQSSSSEVSTLSSEDKSPFSGTWIINNYIDEYDAVVPLFNDAIIKLSFDDEGNVTQTSSTTAQNASWEQSGENEAKVLFSDKSATLTLIDKEEKLALFDDGTTKAYAININDALTQNMDSSYFANANEEGLFWISFENEEMFYFHKIDNTVLVMPLYFVSGYEGIYVKMQDNILSYYLHEDYYSDSMSAFVFDVKTLSGEDSKKNMRLEPNQYAGTMYIDDIIFEYGGNNVEEVKAYLTLGTTYLTDYHLEQLNFSSSPYLSGLGSGAKDILKVEAMHYGSFSAPNNFDALAVIRVSAQIPNEGTDVTILALYDDFTGELLAQKIIGGNDVSTTILPTDYPFSLVLTTTASFTQGFAEYTIEALQVHNGQFVPTQNIFDFNYFYNASDDYKYKFAYEDNMLKVYGGTVASYERLVETLLWNPETLSFTRDYPFSPSTDLYRGDPIQEVTFLSEEQINMYETLGMYRHIGLIPYQSELMSNYTETITHSGNYFEYVGVSYEDYYELMTSLMTINTFDKINNTYDDTPVVININDNFTSSAMQADGASPDLKHLDRIEHIYSDDTTIKFNLIRYLGDMEEIYAADEAEFLNLKPIAYQVYPFTLSLTDSGWRFTEFSYPHYFNDIY